jgi:hypothetical protein
MSQWVNTEIASHGRFFAGEAGGREGKFGTAAQALILHSFLREAPFKNFFPVSTAWQSVSNLSCASRGRFFAGEAGGREVEFGTATHALILHSYYAKRLLKTSFQSSQPGKVFQI